MDRARPTCCGVQQPFVVISYPRQLSGSGRTSSTRRHQSEISESTSTLTSTCDATFREPSLVALPFCASCAVSDIQFQRPCTRRSLSPLSCHGWITAMLCWQAYQATCTTICSRCSMLPHVPSPACDARTTSVTHSPS